MSEAAISVVVPVYNGEVYLRPALDSIFRQTLLPAQVLVIDDGSTDGSAEVARRCPNVELLRQENLGAAAARNRGVEAARGELLAFLDADDLWTPEKLHCQVDCL